MIRLFSLFAVMLFLAACDKTQPIDPGPSSAQVQFIFQNQVDGQPLVTGSPQYTNAAGNAYNIDILKYYVSNFELVRADGTGYPLHNYDLIDVADPGSAYITAAAVPNDEYVALRFLLGVDSIRNHTGAQDGDLDPVHGMTWNWNTGYIFFKHEGSFIATDGSTKGLVYHYGTDLALAEVEVPLDGGLVVHGVARTVHLVFDLGQLYAGPNVIDFNVDNFRQSALAADRPWLGHLQQNFPGAFRFDRME